MLRCSGRKESSRGDRKKKWLLWLGDLLYWAKKWKILKTMKARFLTVGEVFTNIKKKKVKNNPEVLHWNWTCWLCSGKYEFMACVYTLLTHTDIELVIDVYVCAYTHVCTYTDFLVQHLLRGPKSSVPKLQWALWDLRSWCLNVVLH